MLRHLIPNIGSLLVLEFTRGIMYAVLAEVVYSFIGIGIRYPNYSLGSLIAEAAAQINTLPHMFWFPIIFFFLIVAPLAFMNDGLRDAFDPTSMSVGSVKNRKKNKKAQKIKTVKPAESLTTAESDTSESETKKEEVKNS